MKNFKKITALLLGIMMVLAMSVTSFAANHTITNNTKDHTYEVYQIFKGTYNAESGLLESLEYGENTTKTKDAAVSQEDMQTLAAYTDAGSTQALDQQDITFISQFVDLNSNPVASLTNGQQIDLAEGYYLIKDEDNSLAGTNEQYTLYLISILSDNITISGKTGTTTAEKKIDDVNDSTGDKKLLQDSADYDIGDDVPYTLTAKLADNVSAYKQYHIVFEDELEAGKLKNNQDYVVTIKYNDDRVATLTDSDYTLKENTDNGFKLRLDWGDGTNVIGADAKLDGAVVTVKFTAKLTENAIIGQPGNLNTFRLKYSNNPNNADGGEEGTTPDDRVLVFTYDLVVNKIDEKGNPLTGASFALYKEYTAEQLTAAGKTAVTEIKYAGNEKTYALGGKNYVKIDEISGAAKSQFTFTGIDDGNYLLVETIVPSGYNPLDPKTFTVTATHTPSADISAAKKNVNGDAEILTDLDGTDIEVEKHIANSALKGLTSSIENKSGTVLPSTGGIGTTIFYVAGALLVLVASVLLVTKRRVNAQ